MNLSVRHADKAVVRIKPHAVLTEQLAIEIYWYRIENMEAVSFAVGRHASMLAARFGVSEKTIRDIFLLYYYRYPKYIPVIRIHSSLSSRSQQDSSLSDSRVSPCRNSGIVVAAGSIHPNPDLPSRCRIKQLPVQCWSTRPLLPSRATESQCACVAPGCRLPALHCSR